MKNTKKIISLVLAICMLASLAISASAANTVDASGGTGTSSVTLSSTADGSIGGDPAATKMSVTVPTVLPIAVGTDGTVSTATDAKIVNNSFGAVKVANVSIEAAQGWSLAAFGDKATLAHEKVNANKFGFQISLGNGEKKLTDDKNASEQTLLAAAYVAMMIWTYRRVVGLFDGEPLRRRAALPWTFGLLLLAGCDFLAIRGGTGASVANVSKVYFSSNMFLNHAATNPFFSFLTTLGDHTDYASEYPFFDETTRTAKFDALRGNGPASGPSERVLTKTRPNVVVVNLESFARTIMDADVDGRPVMPNMRRLRDEGIWFENFFANSFRTDRGEVAVLRGFPAQTRMSIMKLPAKSRSLPSLARSLAREGYATSFVYGGDLNFTNQASYMYATGWQQLVWQRDLRFDTPPSDWGYDDAVMCDWFAARVIALSESREPFLAGLLTLSSHTPFDVPYAKFDDRVLNAMAFSDDCVGKMIDRLKASPAWENLLVVLVADHGYPYPRTLAYNEPLRHRIPMIWTGGAVARPRVVEDYASQIDIAAPLLAQLGVPHGDIDYSKDIFAPTPPRKFAYYAFNDGFGVVDASGEAVWDATGGRAVTETNPELLDVGRTMLQTTYVDIGRR